MKFYLEQLILVSVISLLESSEVTCLISSFAELDNTCQGCPTRELWAGPSIKKKILLLSRIEDSYLKKDEECFGFNNNCRKKRNRTLKFGKIKCKMNRQGKR